MVANFEEEGKEEEVAFALAADDVVADLEEEGEEEEGAFALAADDVVADLEEEGEEEEVLLFAVEVVVEVARLVEIATVLTTEEDVVAMLLVDVDASCRASICV